jgi:hypothetical protein
VALWDVLLGVGEGDHESKEKNHQVIKEQTSFPIAGKMLKICRKQNPTEKQLFNF